MSNFFIFLIFAMFIFPTKVASFFTLSLKYLLRLKVTVYLVKIHFNEVTRYFKSLLRST